MTNPESSQPPDSPDASEGAAGSPRRVAAGRRKGPLFWIVYAIVLTVSLVFATYQGVRYFSSRLDGDQSPGVVSVRRGRDGRIGPPTSAPAPGPGEMTDNPLAGVGMTPVKGDPGGLAPPSGAIWRWAFERSAGQEREIMALYSWDGSPEQAGEYYKKYLIEKGMKFLGERKFGEDSPSSRPAASRKVRPRWMLLFHGAGQNVTVTLRKPRRTDGMLSIAISVTYPKLQR